MSVTFPHNDLENLLRLSTIGVRLFFSYYQIYVCRFHFKYYSANMCARYILYFVNVKRARATILLTEAICQNEFKAIIVYGGWNELFLQLCAYILMNSHIQNFKWDKGHLSGNPVFSHLFIWWYNQTLVFFEDIWIFCAIFVQFSWIISISIIWAYDQDN